jgi:exonuclease SbcC
MHVKLVGFKCHIDAHYDFPSNSMILLKGPSGSGKSTILQAIYWALYGGMRGIYNNTGEVKTCSVTLSINNIIIYRQKRPELLRVTLYNDNKNNNSMNEYEDVVAQEIINQHLGDKKLWKSCSYIDQKQRCELLSGSASERLSLLNRLSFSQDDPKEYIDKIDQELKAMNKLFLSEQADYCAEHKLFTEAINTRPIKTIKPDNDIRMLKQKILDLEDRSKELYEKVLTHERTMGSYNLILDQIKMCNDKISSFPSHSDYDYDKTIEQINRVKTGINSLETIMKNITSYLDTKGRYDQLKHEKEEIDKKVNGMDNNSIINSGLYVTSEDVWKVNNIETQRSHNISLSQKLGYEYNKDQIQAEITRLENTIPQIRSLESNIGTYKRLNSLKSNNNNDNIYNDNQNNNSISELEDESKNLWIQISEARKSQNTLVCPECTKPLRYTGIGLVPESNPPVSSEKIKDMEIKYKTLLDNISKLREQINTEKEIETLTEQLSQINTSDMEEYMSNPNPISSSVLQTKLSNLKQIQFIDQPQYSSTFLRDVLNYNLLTERRNKITSEMDNINVPDLPSHDKATILKILQDKRSELANLETLHTQTISQLNQKKYQESLLSSYVCKKTELERLLDPLASETYNTLLNNLNNLKNELNESEYGNAMALKQRSLKDNREKVLILHQDLISLEGLKRSAINVECKQLQDTVNVINQTMENILPLFFDDPITMKLQLYKKLKTKKEIKPGLNISIKYKGTEYDNINQLSGGEGDRISLALILSLNQVSDSPIILLDESISSLDGHIKESCVGAMRQIQNKIIVCVDHEGVEGFYDNVIHMK